MKNVLRKTLLVTLFALLAACGGPTLDSTTEESLDASAETLMASLKEGEVQQFQKDIDVIAKGIRNDMGGMTIENMRNPEKMEKAFMAAVDGKSASDIHEMANKYREE